MKVLYTRIGRHYFANPEARSSWHWIIPSSLCEQGATTVRRNGAALCVGMTKRRFWHRDAENLARRFSEICGRYPAMPGRTQTLLGSISIQRVWRARQRPAVLRCHPHFAAQHQPSKPHNRCITFQQLFAALSSGVRGYAGYNAPPAIRRRVNPHPHPEIPAQAAHRLYCDDSFDESPG